jgi:hypothetical protein
MSELGKLRGFKGLRHILSLAALAWLVSGSASFAYTPNDPVVTKMVDRGIEYLENLGPEAFPGEPSQFNGIAGETVLAAYAHHKCRHDPEHPVVKRGLDIARGIVAALPNRGEQGAKRNYEMTMCVLLFAEVDAERYKSELKTIQSHLMEWQFPNGAFGYYGDTEGDVSQTQYALLAIWTLDRNGIPMDYSRVVDSAQWLLRVQDVNGSWPYKGKDPGVGRPNLAQYHPNISMGLAGGSSLLIAGDALRLWGETVDDEDPGIPGFPKAIKVYKEDTNTVRRRRVAMSEEPIKRSIAALNAWRQSHPYKRTSMLDWYYYQLYSLERFESFYEIANGLPKDSSPAWYNQGVDELRSFQGADGGWTDPANTRGPVSTAFALLFLIRSTQKTIFTLSQGSLQGGYGLPKDTTDIRVEGTQIKGRPIAAQVTDMLDILEKDGAGETEGKSLPDDLELDQDPVARAAQLDRLERLVRGSRSWQARRVAAQLLGRSDELRVVPALIYALSDPDESVRRYARDGLRFLSRKFDGFGMPDRPNQAEIEQAQQAWRDWYRTVNPKHVFLDYDL